MSLISELSQNPLKDLQMWIELAAQSGLPDPNAMTLATANTLGQPSARVVLCKTIAADGLHFFTNYESRKSKEMLTNPEVSAVFFWPTLARQIRVEGKVSKLTRKDSEEYFNSRPRGSQIGAWVSNQSSPISSFVALEEMYRQIEKEFEGQNVPCPPHWGGFLITPTMVEFWIGLPSRLHDRVAVLKTLDEGQIVWVKTQVAP